MPTAPSRSDSRLPTALAQHRAARNSRRSTPSAPLAVALAGNRQVVGAYAMASAPAAEAPWGSLARLVVEEPDAEPEPVQVAPWRCPKRPPSRHAGQKAEQPGTEALAFAKPDRPADPKPFNKLFKRQDSVAIYDISAGSLMPDGSKLEAHSGIGKMADNPKYVHVRNSGPTPPNTYKLTMRKYRFYGVEAIRMTPLDGSKPMHGRDGFLTHSYLLRSRRPKSHGCVAFANYPQFLKAFKQGKVTHLVVVPSLKDATVPKVRTQRGA